MGLCIGLTGGIGCGKSTVAELFARHGAGIIDTDELSLDLTRTGGEAITPIRAAFGDAYITTDGALDRTRMRRLVFTDSVAKQRLEDILHPRIRDLARQQLRLLQNKPYIVIVVPLLPESRAFRQMVQRVLVVDCDENTQIERVVTRNRMQPDEVRDIIARQTPRTERLQIADDVIHNDGSLDSLAKQVGILHVHYANRQNNI